MASIFDDIFGFVKDNKDVISAGAGIYDFFQDRSQGKDLMNFARGGTVDPFGDANRRSFQSRLQGIYDDPSGLENLPGFKFARDQGEKAINRGAAKRGEFFSGNAMTELSRFNTGLASQFYSDELERLMKLSGAYFGPNSSVSGGLYGSGLAQRGNAAGHLTAGFQRGAGISDLFSAVSKIPGVGEAMGLPGIGDIPGIEGLFGGGEAVSSLGSFAPGIGSALGTGAGSVGLGASGVASSAISGAAAPTSFGAFAPGIGSSLGTGAGAVGTGAGGSAGAAGGASGALAGGAGAALGAALPLALAAFGWNSIRGKQAAKRSYMAPHLDRLYANNGQTATMGGVTGIPFQFADGNNYLVAPGSADPSARGNGRALYGVFNPSTGQYGSLGMGGFYTNGLASNMSRSAFMTPEQRSSPGIIEQFAQQEQTRQSRLRDSGAMSFGD